MHFFDPKIYDNHGQSLRNGTETSQDAILTSSSGFPFYPLARDILINEIINVLEIKRLSDSIVMCALRKFLPNFWLCATETK